MLPVVNAKPDAELLSDLGSTVAWAWRKIKTAESTPARPMASTPAIAPAIAKKPLKKHGAGCGPGSGNTKYSPLMRKCARLAPRALVLDPARRFRRAVEQRGQPQTSTGLIRQPCGVCIRRRTT
jgi:hypothetical protein